MSTQGGYYDLRGFCYTSGAGDRIRLGVGEKKILGRMKTYTALRGKM